MKLSAKLTVMIVVLLLGIACIGGFSIMQMRNINEKTVEVSLRWMPSSIILQSIDTMTSDYRAYEINQIYSEDKKVLEEFEGLMNDKKAQIAQAMAIYEKMATDAESKQLYTRFTANWQQYLAISADIVALSNALQTQQAVDMLLGDSRSLFEQTAALLTDAVSRNEKNGQNAALEAENTYKSATSMVLFFMLVLIVAAAGLGVYIVHGTIQQLGKDPGQLMLLAQRVTRGDYKIDDGSPSLGVYGSLIHMVQSLSENIEHARKESEIAFNESEKATKALRKAEVMGREAEGKTAAILKAADKLREVAHIVSAAAQKLSAQIEQSERGAAEQAARVTETATAMEQMNSTVLEVARNAGTASQVSANTRQKAEVGAEVVRQVVRGMGEVQQQASRLKDDMSALNENAKAIHQIMGVISDIADQTNLLALNAAIEAARAGDAGRGFAVVADEVRKLAEKTMASTTDVGNAIKNIQQSVDRSMSQVEASGKTIEDATAFAHQSGDALKEIVNMADITADQVRAIATASEEQSASSDEINQSINQVNAIAGETARTMADSATAVTELNQQAQILTHLIAEMKRI